MINDGGPAFPTDEYFDEKRVGQSGGMSLRDAFALAALSGWYSGTSNLPDDRNLPRYADSFYKMADAMIAARKEKS